MSQNDRTKRNTQHTTATWTRRHARQRQLEHLSDSSGRTAARLILRRRSTVAVGRSDHVSVPRSTAKHGRRRHFGRYGHAAWISASLSRPSHAMSSNSVERCRWQRRVESASRRPPNSGTQQTARSSHGRPFRAQIISTASSQ